MLRELSDCGTDGCFMFTEDCFTSLVADDDPHWSQALKGNDRQKWLDAMDVERRTGLGMFRHGVLQHK